MLLLDAIEKLQDRCKCFDRGERVWLQVDLDVGDPFVREGSKPFRQRFRRASQWDRFDPHGPEDNLLKSVGQARRRPW